jgi:WD40 repeat protein
VKATLLFLAAGLQIATASTSSVWEMSTFADFMKGKFDGVSLGRDGTLSVAPRLDTLFDSGQPAIWSVVPGPDGSLYAATGHRGRVFRIDAKGATSLLWASDRPEVFALAVDPKGVVYAAGSPDGKIYRIQNGQATEYFDPKAKYIWALALAPDGTLFAGTGDGGRVFRITGAGQGEEYYATGQANVTSLLLDPQGRLLAGTEPNGILYRITAKNKAFVLYDSSLPEIRAIAPNPDGSIYAVGLGGALAKKVQATQQSGQPAQQDSTPVVTSVTVTADAGGDLKPNPPEPVKPPPPVAAAATTTTGSSAVVDLSGVEKSAIYRIEADNTVDTVWSSKEENVFDLLPAPDGQLYFGTDQNGRVYRLTPDRKLTLLAQTNEVETVRLLQWNGAMLAATANLGKVYRLGAAAGAKGSYESPAFDAGTAARWGKLRWVSAGSATFQTRSGNSLRPDATWSDWSPALTNARGTQIASPNARYLQFRTELTGNATIGNVSAAYLAQNGPPVVRSVTVLTQPAAAATSAKSSGASTNPASSANAPYSITVTDTGDPAPVASTGTPTQTLSRALGQQLLISWQAEDADGDKLVYQLDFRGDGEREWKTLRRGLHENTVTLDGDALGDGRYLFRVTASDRESNATGAKEADLISSPVLIDNTPPVIRIQSSTRSGAAADVTFEAHDDASALRRAEWSLDAGPWTPLAPTDGILDSETEQFRLHLDSVPAGEHLLVIRVADSGNNTGLARVILH